MEKKAKRLEGEEMVDDSKETVSSGHNGIDAHKNTQTVAMHTGPAQVESHRNPSTGERQWMQSPTPSLEGLI